MFLGVSLAVVALIGSALLRRAFRRTAVLVEEVALGAAWGFVGGALVWFDAYLRDATLLGFGAPWTWLAAAHFAVAGFGSLTLTALSCRTVTDPRALRSLRTLVFVHPVAYLVTAAGISGVNYCDELGALFYESLFLVQLFVFLRGTPTRIARAPRFLVVFALGVPLVTLVPSLSWAFGAPIFGLSEMVRYHGLVNAVGHVGLGFGAFAWGRPEPHAPLITPARPS